MADESDPTKDSEFQKVVRHFVTTPHKPHKPVGKSKSKASASQKKLARPKKKDTEIHNPPNPPRQG
jgi:hypothetical protein